MDTFFKWASPTTLASFIADLDRGDVYTNEMNILRDRCEAELVAIVGEDEAHDMIDAASDVV